MLDSGFTFETFVVGPPNRLAAGAARRVAESPGTQYNPLFLHGASGLGKTHLLQAIGHEAARIRTELAILHDTMENLLDELVGAIDAGEEDAFGRQMREYGLVLLEDAQDLTGRMRAQYELIRVWDALLAAGGQVVMTADRAPSAMDGIDERLRSRLSAGLLAEIGAPDQDIRLAVARRLAGERRLGLADEVAVALARIAFPNIPELQGALTRLAAVQELEGRRVRADEVATILGLHARHASEFDAFLAGVREAVENVVVEPGEPGEESASAGEPHAAGDAGAAADAGTEPPIAAAGPTVRDPWFLSREKLLWVWPYPEQLISEDPG